MPSTTTPNMGLVAPTVGAQPGPTWANNINSDLSTIDSHDHSVGSGVKITPDGMNITTDLAFNENNATELRSIRFEAQGSPLGLGTDLGCLYVSGVDLYYNDENGNQIQMTASGGVAGTPGSITTLTPPASVVYTSFNQTYTFNSAVNTPGNLNAGAVTIREVLASSNGITLSSPSSLASSYSVTFPSALPAATRFLMLSNSGVMTAPAAPDNSTIEISGTDLQVKDLGITTAKLAAKAVTAAKIDDATITGTQIADDVNLSGSLVKAGSLPLALAGYTTTKNMAIVAFALNSAGSLVSGGGVSVTGHPGTGQYTFTYTNAFSTNPIIVGIPVGVVSVYVTVQSSNGVTGQINVLDLATGVGVDNATHIMVIGERS